MQTITAEEFNKKYGTGASSSFQAPIDNKVDIFDQIKQAFQGGVNKIGQGVEEANPLGQGGVGGLITGVGKIAGGATEAITSPLAPALNATVGKGINFIGNKVGDIPAVQKFAQSPAGETTSKIAGTVSDYSNAAALIAGGPKGIKNIAETPAKIVNSVDSISTPKLPDFSGATSNIKSAVKDVAGTLQNRIDHNIATALDLTPGDLSKIEASTGNQVGKWLSDNNLIGTNKATTQAAIDEFYKQNYEAVRSEIGKVTQVYKPSQVPRLTDALKAIQTQLGGALGLEKDVATIDNLLNKKTLVLKDVQKVKEMLDDHFNLYKATGDVADNVTKQGLANVRSDLKGFIEGQVKKYTNADIKQLNNNVSTARSLSDAITTRDPRGLTRSMLSQRDIMMGMGLTYFGSPLFGLAYVLVKKVATSPSIRLRLARFLDQLSDTQKMKISTELSQGKVPPDIKNIAGDLPQQ